MSDRDHRVQRFQSALFSCDSCTLSFFPSLSSTLSPMHDYAHLISSAENVTRDS